MVGHRLACGGLVNYGGAGILRSGRLSNVVQYAKGSPMIWMKLYEVPDSSKGSDGDRLICYHKMRPGAEEALTGSVLIQ